MTNYVESCLKSADPQLKLAILKILALEWKRRQARVDPAAFAEFCFTDESGKPMQLPQVHRDLQVFLTNAPRGLVELPRDHGKTVQVLIRAIWELGNNPNLRIRIVCSSGALADQRGRFIRDAIANNPRVQLVFPHLKPDRPWQVRTFSVRRKGNSVSPSVVVSGIGAAATGARADLLICDDVVDVKALRSQTIREKTTQIYHENLINMLEPGGRAWSLYTPWHSGDLNAELKQNPAYQHFHRAVGDNLEPVWPEKWPKERLQERRKEIGEASFARAFRLQTIAEDDCMIKPKWVQYCHAPDATALDSIRKTCEAKDWPYDFVVLAVDPAVSRKHTADASALVTLGRTLDGKVHCLEAIARRASAPELMQLIDDADQRWQPDVIVFESNAAFSGIKDLMVAQMRFGSKVKGLSNHGEKHARVHAFGVRVENGAVKLNGDGHRVDPSQQELLDEMLSYPQGRHDDLVDAAAFGSAYLLNTKEPRVRCL
jgi:predicted phage terminase large subunit-like protein